MEGVVLYTINIEIIRFFVSKLLLLGIIANR